MKQSVLIKSAISCGGGALDYLDKLSMKNAVVIADNRTVFAQDAVKKIEDILGKKETNYNVKSDMSSKPGFAELLSEAALIKEMNADTVIAVGDDTTINAAKLMLLLYEYPGKSFEDIRRENDIGVIKLQTRLVVIAASSGMAEEVNRLGAIMIDDTGFIAE